MGDNKLQHLTFLVTRPQSQAQGLATAIEQAAGTALVQPTIAILPLNKPHNLAALKQCDGIDMAIFVSQNAAIYGLPYLQAYLNDKVLVASVGNKTAAVLQQHGIDNVLYPRTDYNSEALLALNAMQQVSAKRIVIVSGEKGRQKLAETLSKRGAEVITLCVYQAHLPDTNINEVITNNQIDCIICSSLLGLKNLLTLCPKQHVFFSQVLLIVITQTMKDYAASHGFTNILQVANANDETMMKALTDYYRHEELEDE